MNRRRVERQVGSTNLVVDLNGMITMPGTIPRSRTYVAFIG